MIPEFEFEYEISAYIRAFIAATQTDDRDRIAEQATACAALITGLARVTNFNKVQPHDQR